MTSSIRMHNSLPESDQQVACIAQKGNPSPEHQHPFLLKEDPVIYEDRKDNTLKHNKRKRANYATKQGTRGFKLPDQALSTGTVH